MQDQKPLPSPTRPKPIVSRRPWPRPRKEPRMQSRSLELIHSPYQVERLNFRHPASARKVRELSDSWVSFMDSATPEERNEVLPSFGRFVDEILDLIMEKPEGPVAKEFLENISYLTQVEPREPIKALLKIAEKYRSMELSDFAIIAAEKNAPFLFSSPEKAPYSLIRDLLLIYESDPKQLLRPSAEGTAKALSGFLFSHSNHLMNNGHKDLLAFALSWGAGINAEEKARLMEHISDSLDHASQVNIFTRMPFLLKMLPVNSNCTVRKPVSEDINRKFPELKRVLDSTTACSISDEINERQYLLFAAIQCIEATGSNFMIYPHREGQLH
ncbi:hypothetical protein GF415_04165 [Candidatus Micrarchaeota archaeon]|nr:hypothetical protein [Candidatus Micrarchaeota archaeon]